MIEILLSSWKCSRNLQCFHSSFTTWQMTNCMNVDFFLSTQKRVLNYIRTALQRTLNKKCVMFIALSIWVEIAYKYWQLWEAWLKTIAQHDLSTVLWPKTTSRGTVSRSTRSYSFNRNPKKGQSMFLLFPLCQFSKRWIWTRYACLAMVTSPKSSLLGGRAASF